MVWIGYKGLPNKDRVEYIPGEQIKKVIVRPLNNSSDLIILVHGELLGRVLVPRGKGQKIVVELAKIISKGEDKCYLITDDGRVEEVGGEVT